MVMIWFKVKESASSQEKMWDVIYDFDFALTTATSTGHRHWGFAKQLSIQLYCAKVSNNHHKTNVALKFDLNFDPPEN